MCSSTLRAVFELTIGSDATVAQTPYHEILLRTDLGGHNSEKCYRNDYISTLASALSPGKYLSILGKIQQIGRLQTAAGILTLIPLHIISRGQITQHYIVLYSRGLFITDTYENTASCFFFFSIWYLNVTRKHRVDFKNLILTQIHYLPYDKDSSVIHFYFVFPKHYMELYILYIIILLCCSMFPKHYKLHASKSN